MFGWVAHLSFCMGMLDDSAGRPSNGGKAKGAGVNTWPALPAETDPRRRSDPPTEMAA
jgi:hypothetical protein